MNVGHWIFLRIPDVQTAPVAFSHTVVGDHVSPNHGVVPEADAVVANAVDDVVFNQYVLVSRRLYPVVLSVPAFTPPRHHTNAPDGVTLQRNILVSADGQSIVVNIEDAVAVKQDVTARTSNRNSVFARIENVVLGQGEI